MTKVVEKIIGYDILSPDGFSIIPPGEDFFKTVTQAENHLKEWIKNYEKQGYYSTIKNQRRIQIPLDELANHCKFVPIT